MTSRKVFFCLLLVLTVSMMSVVAVSAQKATSVPSEPEEIGDEVSSEETPDILTLPILSDGAPRELTLEGTTGALLAAFNASEGDIVTISMTSDDIDPYLVILDESGYPLAMNDDANGLNAEIEDFEVPADGSYFIVATTWSSRNTDEELEDSVFELLVEGNTQPAGLDDDSFSYMVYTLEIGESYDLVIDEEVPLYLIEFYGEAGQEVVLDAESSELDTLMMLFDVNGNRVAADDDSGEVVLSAYIETELPVTGLYLLLVTTYDYVQIADGADVTEGPISFSSR